MASGFLMQWKWFTRPAPSTNYAIRANYLGMINGKPKLAIIIMHRVITNAPDGMSVDHIDGNGLNNQKGNLRICTTAENSSNCKSYKNSISKYVGVSLIPDDRKRKWTAQINKNRKIIYISRHLTEEEAALARDRFIIENNLVFSRLNILTR